MQPEHGSIQARLSADAPQVAVLTPLALVLGARAGLSIEQIDDLTMAIEMLVLHQPRVAREARFTVEAGRLDVLITAIDQEWLDHRTPIIEVLVSKVLESPGGARLRVDA